MRKSKIVLVIAVLALSMGAYGCSYPYATRNDEVKVTVSENVKSISLHENTNSNK